MALWLIMRNQDIPTPLVLGSGSSARARILRDAGVPFRVKPPNIDESAALAGLLTAAVDVEASALHLAEMKALEVCGSLSNTVVISGDQILECEGRWFQKASTLEHARRNLEHLSNRKHRLVTGLAVAKDGEIIWQHVDQAVLSVRHLSPVFLDAYFDTVGQKALESVGGYQIESIGAQLFNRIEGDYMTILGLPLIPLLNFLRANGFLGW